MPLKRQRIDFQEAPKVTKRQKKRKGKKEQDEVVLDNADNSSENENDEIIAEDEEEGNFEGMVYYSQNRLGTDEMAIDEPVDSEESEQDDFQDVKSKSILSSFC